MTKSATVYEHSGLAEPDELADRLDNLGDWYYRTSRFAEEEDAYNKLPKCCKKPAGAANTSKTKEVQ
jgi:hypothetical protein